VSGYRKAPRSVALALGPLRAKLAPDTALAEIQRVWPAVVGDAIAASATPTSERAGVLTVACEAAVWAQELDLMAPSILAGLNAELTRGSVTRLKCVTGH
jgi:predicted nucleic acid-binding Zn ribbon protein